MKRSFNKVKNKKAFLALESLLGVIISVVALFFIFQTFFNVFFQTPTNLKIAQDNAKSIVEFIDFSDNKYSTYNDCFTILRLSNLENYQFKDSNDKNYFYTINNKGVNIYNIKNYENLISSNSFNNLYEKKLNFKNNLKLKYDNTNKGSIISFDFYWTSFGKASNSLNFQKNSNILLLIPIFNKDNQILGTNLIKDNQNILYGKVLVDNNFENPNGNNLIYKPSTNELFLSKSDYSNSLIKSKNCEIKSYNDNSLKQNGYDPTYTDNINYELTFDALVDKKEQNFKFIWSVQQIKCPDNNCKKYLGENYNSLSFDVFKEKLAKIYENKYKLIGNEISFKIIKRKYIGNGIFLKFSQLDISKLYSQNFLFNKINNQDLKFNNLEKNNQDLIEKKLKNYFGDFVFDDFNNRNDCKDLICNYFGYKNNKAYFYNNNLNSFVTIREDLFRNKNKNLYYIGSEIKGDISNHKALGWFGFREEGIFNSYNKIDTKEGYTSIILSNKQFLGLENI